MDPFVITAQGICGSWTSQMKPYFQFTIWQRERKNNLNNFKNSSQNDTDHLTRR